MNGDALTLSLLSWTWFGLALVLFAIEALRPGRFALWLGFAAVLVGGVASVARWPWAAEFLAPPFVRPTPLPSWARLRAARGVSAPVKRPGISGRGEINVSLT